MNDTETPTTVPRSTALFGLCLAVTAIALTLGALAFSQHKANERLLARLDAVETTPRPGIVDVTAPAGAMNHASASVEKAVAVVTQPRSEPPPAAPVPEPILYTPTTPSPLVQFSTNRFGGVTERRTFMELPGPGGRLLARDAEFSRQLGRRLFFQTRGQPLALDVTDVHADVLHYLGIDAQEAIDAQLQMEKDRQIAAEKAEERRLVRLEEERKWYDARQKALAEQARIAEARARTATTDQLVALAAASAAQAANRPPPAPTVVVVEQPAPVQSWPIFFVPRRHHHYHHNADFRFVNPFPVAPQTTPVPASSSFRFIQQTETSNPFAFGRRL